MALPLLCDEHIPYPIVEGMRRRGLDIAVVQQMGLRSTRDELILEAAQQQRRVVYTRDADFLRHHAAGVEHAGILYHPPLLIPLEKQFEGLFWPVKSSLWMK